MTNTRKWLRRIGMLALLLGVYPMGVLVYTWSCVAQSDFGGGRHGPLDAYRHALASAVVSYTLGGWAVDVVTGVMESDGGDSNRMDSHNNRIGVRIGATATSFRGLEPSVRRHVRDGTVNATDRNRITWLTKDKWRDRWMW